MSALRDMMVDRLKQMGWHIETPKQADLVKWRKPKDVNERLTRQMVWGQAVLDKGHMPHWVDVADPLIVDDETLLVMFERSCRQVPPGGTNGIGKTAPVAVGKHFGRVGENEGWIIEFRVYDARTNDYGLPDPKVIREWLAENCAEPATMVSSSFVLFESDADASLCLIRFR